MKKLILCVLFLAGCTTIDAGQIAEKGAAVNDEARESAEFVICRAISVGAWTRAYGQNAERAQAWRTLCSPRIEHTP